MRNLRRFRSKQLERSGLSSPTSTQLPPTTPGYTPRMSWYERHIFNPLLERALHTPAMDAERARLLEQASGRLLEIGPGTGLNFPHYPAEIERITTISPDEELPAITRSRVRERGATLQHFTSSAAPWPFADGLFDTVVCTLVLCTIPDVAGILAEVRRVLTPQGKLLVFEHVLARRPLHAACQHLITPVSRIMACGCHANRTTRASIEQAGFTWELLEERSSDGLPAIVSSTIFGVALPSGAPAS